MATKSKHDWMDTRWRPAMAWMYLTICICDFIIFPIVWSAIQALYGGEVHNQWQPLTLQGAGFFHVAMGAVLGITAYGRTQEKIYGVSNDKMPRRPRSPMGINRRVPDYDQPEI